MLDAKALKKELLRIQLKIVTDAGKTSADINSLLCALGMVYPPRESKEEREDVDES